MGVVDLKKNLLNIPIAHFLEFIHIFFRCHVVGLFLALLFDLNIVKHSFKFIVMFNSEQRKCTIIILLSSNQTRPYIIPKICLLPLSSLHTTSSQQVTTSLSAHPHPQMMTMMITTKCFLSITIVLTHSDVSLEYEYHPSAPLSTTTKWQRTSRIDTMCTTNSMF